MLQTIIVLFKRGARVIRWIDKDTLDLTREFLFECFEGEEVITKNEAIIERVVVGHALMGVIRSSRRFPAGSVAPAWVDFLCQSKSVPVFACGFATSLKGPFQISLAGDTNLS